MSYKKNIASNFMFQIIRITVEFILSILVARALGAEGQGEIAYLFLIFSLLGSYGHLGINNSTMYFQKRTSYKEEEILNSNLTYLIINILFLTIIFSMLKHFQIAFSNYSFIIILLGMLFVFSNYTQVLLQSFYIGQEKIHKSNIYLFVGLVIKFILIVVLYILDSLTVINYILIQIILFVIPSVLLYLNLGMKYKPKINFTLLKEEFKYGIIIYFSSLFIFLNYRADQFLIKNFLSIANLGVYSIAVRLAELVFLIPTSITTALSGRLYNVNINDKVVQKRIVAKTIKYTFYMCSFLVLLGIFMTPLVPIVYGKEFWQASKVITILFVGVIFASIGKVSAPYFFSKGEPQVHLLITLLTLLINIILNLFTIPKFGINGAAYASTISYMFYGISYLMIFIIKEEFVFKDFFYISRNEARDLLILFFCNYSASIVNSLK
jgi:O-antigen/teichoic acid export membrane protein